MVEVTGFQAGIESNDSQISYGVETVWGTKPATAFQAIRYTGESLTQTRTRQRPTEISGTREAQVGITTQQTAAGTINYALSYGTFDDFFVGVLQNEWQAAQAVNGAGGDIVLTAGPPITLASATAGKFDQISALQWIRLLGFTNTINNAWWFVSAKSSPDVLTLTGPAVPITETPSGTNAKIRCSSVKNGTTMKTLFLQKSMASNMYFTYPGAYPTRMVLNGGIGNYSSGTIDVVANSETKQVTNQSTGAVLAAPTGRVIDPIGGFVGAFWNETALSSGIDRFTLTLENTGAAAEFAMGSIAAQGILGGTFTASATVRAYFKTFTEYDLMTNETLGRLAFIMKDSAGSSYAFTLLSAVLADARIVAGGPGTPVYAEFTVEGGPAATGGTVVIDRMAGS